MKNKMQKPVAVGDVLKKSFERLGIKTKVKGFAIMNIWDKIVGSNISNAAMPAKVIGKTLYVTVSTSVWMEELKYHKIDIIDRINKNLGDDTISDIVFKLGKVDSIRIPKKQNHVKRRSLTQEEKRTIARLTSSLKDDELKVIIAGIIEKQKATLL